MKRRLARQIRAGIEAAHLPHRLREIWAITHQNGTSPLTLKAFIRTRQRMREDRLVGSKYSPNLNDGVDWSRVSYTYDPTKED